MGEADQHHVRLFEDSSPRILLVHLGLSYRVCNFRCHYCYLPSWNKEIDLGLVLRIDRLLDRLKRVKRPLYVVFASDGEISVTPALWPYLRKLLELKNLRMVTIFSNLSNDLDKILDIFPAKKMSIIATYHIHQFKNNEKRKRSFFQRVETLKNEVVSIVVSFILSPDQLPYYAEFKETMDRIGALSYAYPLLSKNTGKFEPKLYAKHELKRVAEILELDDNPAKIINDFLFGKTIKGLKCAAGRDYIEISAAGEVYRCYAIRKDNQGSLFEPEGPWINLKSEECPLGGCSCNWAVAFSEEVTRNYKRINSLYSFVHRSWGDSGSQSLEVAEDVK